MADEKFLDKKMDRREFLKKAGIGGAGLAPVSYTHLDVYKRQVCLNRIARRAIKDVVKRLAVNF